MSIRARIFFVFVAAIIAGFALLANWIRGDVADRYSESFEEVLVDTANLLAEIITSDLQAGDYALAGLGEALQRLQLRQFSAQIYDLEKTGVDIRVYVTDARGVVQFDSDAGKAVGEDYSQWRDVHRTLRGDYGARATPVPGEMSPGDPAQRLTIAYVAAPIYGPDGIAGVVTVAKPKGNIDRFVANAKTNLLLAVLMSVAMALLLGLMLYIWVSRPLQALVDYAHSIGRGERVAMPQLGDNEIGRVGEAMDGMRQALEDKQYVERYVQSLTHELKSPLTAIHAAAELLGRELPAPRRAQFAATILKETERLNDLTGQLLQLAALEQRRRIEHPEPVAMVLLVQDVIESHAHECEARRLAVSSTGSTDRVVHGDRFLLRQALDNLFRNAMEFSPAGGSIRVELHDLGRDIAVDVVDAGPGIPDYVGERVFERFYSLPRPDTGRKSSGLGLTFAREVAQLHGGALTLESRQPGVRARLCLPAG